MDPDAGRGGAIGGHATPSPAAHGGDPARCRRSAGQPPRGARAASARPMVPPDVPQYFRPRRTAVVGADAGRRGARSTYSDTKLGLDETSDIVDVDAAHRRPGGGRLGTRRAGRLRRRGAHAANRRARRPFAALPPPAAKPKSYPAWTKEFVDLGGPLAERGAAAARHAGLSLASRRARGRLPRPRRSTRCASSVTRPWKRCGPKQAPKLAALEEKIRKAGQNVQKESQQASEQKMSTAVSVGATVLRRAPRPQGGEPEHARARDHGGARRGPDGPRGPGRGPRPGDASTRSAAQREALADVTRGASCSRCSRTGAPTVRASSGWW